MNQRLPLTFLMSVTFKISPIKLNKKQKSLREFLSKFNLSNGQAKRWMLVGFGIAQLFQHSN